MPRKTPPAAPAAYPSLTLLQRGAATVYPTSPDQARLESFPNRHARRDYWISFDCLEFTSLCPVTNQPDFGQIRIRYVPGQLCVESKSLKLYLFSFRNFNTFHEEAVNRILDDFVAACQPRYAEVEGVFQPRGGIAITALASHGTKPAS
ncbi:MAG: preQ(1) synthase [Lentisphaeria bacterium]|jgi:7-cyano-7-deazaguanine reductase